MKDRLRRCKACNELHWESEWPANHVEPRPVRSHLSAPYVISDTMDGLFHPLDNKTYDSKSAFRAATEAGGGIEIGNDKQSDTRYWDTVTPDEVNTARQMVEQGYKPHAEDATADDMDSVI